MIYFHLKYYELFLCSKVVVVVVAVVVVVVAVVVVETFLFVFTDVSQTPILNIIII